MRNWILVLAVCLALGVGAGCGATKRSAGPEGSASSSEEDRAPGSTKQQSGREGS